MTFVPVKPARAYDIEVECRAVSLSHPPTIQVGEVFTGLTGDEELSAAVLGKMMSRRHNVRGAAPDRAGEFVRLSLRFGPSRRRRGLVIVLRPGAEGGDFDDLTVRPLTSFEKIRMAAGGEADGHPLRGKASIRESRRDALLLPPPARVEFSLQGPRPAAVLDAAFGVLGAWGDRVRFHIAWGRETLLDEIVEAQPPDGASGWIDRQVELPALSDPLVKLVFETERVRGHNPLGLIACPTIVGRSSTRPLAKNLVLISIDTLRPDHLSCYGYERKTSPNIDMLAERGVRFARVRSPSSYTLPDHVTMLSGQHPLEHGVRDASERIDTQVTPLLARELRARGYLTAAFTGGGYVDPEFGFDSGFDRYDTWDPGSTRSPLRHDFHLGEKRPSLDKPTTGARIISAWIERHAQQPFFLFVHTYLVHNYDPAPEYLNRFASSFGPRTLEEMGVTLVDLLSNKVGPSAELRRVLRNLYDATILQADSIIVGGVIRTLRRLSLMENTVVCVTSDHGEEFFEHEGAGHGRTLYEEVLHVPWVLCDSDGPRGLVVEDWCTLSRVAATMRASLGLPAVPNASGRAWTPGAQLPPRPELLDLVNPPDPALSAVVFFPWKLIVPQGSSDQSEGRLFNLADDPGERHDLAETEHEQLERMRRLLDSMRQAVSRRASGSPGGVHRANPRVQERLRELGYADR